MMSEENASKFLLELCPHIGDQAGELAKACAYLPLVLRIAGSFLEVNEHWNVEKYIAQLNDRKQRLGTLKQSRTSAELTTEPDLLATFELSYNGLSDENQKRWRMLGVFSTSFAATAASAMWEAEEDETATVLGLLLRYSLLDYDATSSRYSLHDLLSDYALSQMDNEEEHDARLKHASHYKDVLRAANQLYKEGGEKVLAGLHLFDLEWENIRAGQAWAAQNLKVSKEIAKLCSLYTHQTYCIDLRLHPQVRISWYETTLSADRLLNNRNNEGADLGNLGNAYYHLGDIHKAIECHEQALIIARKIGNRRGEGYSLGNLGTTYAELGEPRKAIQFHEQHLVIVREIGDRKDEGRLLNNLGNVYAELGELLKAIELLQQALVIARDMSDRRDQGNALGNLGILYKDLGEARKSLEFYEEHLAIAREIGDRHGEGNALFNMGISFYILKEKHHAIDLMKQALEIFDEIGSLNTEKAQNKLKEWGVKE